MPLKPIKIPLVSICPTEFLLPQDKLEEIAAHYNGTPESIQPIVGYQVGPNFYVENGNKRAYFLYSKSHQYILGYRQPSDQDEITDFIELAKKAQRQGVHTLADLTSKIIPREEYNRIISKSDWIE